MRVVFFVLAALFSLTAIGVRLVQQPGWMAVVAIAVAGACLVVGFWLQAQAQGPRVVELNQEQRETIQRMKSEGNHAGAISQVRLWFKYATAEQARVAVAEA